MLFWSGFSDLLARPGSPPKKTLSGCQSILSAATLQMERTGPDGTPDNSWPRRMQRSHSVLRKSGWTPAETYLELVNKTNQFNLNGRRYTESALAGASRDRGAR